ncbi:hypothetical protein E2C01_097125 [Portunus trituberculatus]|uniref:Uncharacterized protein n=1 Tax=Portunus trituberculatus TaxID=210409 RepID=A0A5B7JXH6_PORTR|nr:hypothetical protein [Portunus trituberculatus]
MNMKTCHGTEEVNTLLSTNSKAATFTWARQEQVDRPACYYHPTTSLHRKKTLRKQPSKFADNAMPTITT